MIDNVYELKQRFVGFNKVKLLTVVFYCMTYGLCSFLNEYNASVHNQHINEEQNKEKDKWEMEGETLVCKGKGYTVKYAWNNGFLNFLNTNNIVEDYPAGYDTAKGLIEFLFRHQISLGIVVKEMKEYKKAKSEDLPGCCQSCYKGKYGANAFWVRTKDNNLAERIRTIEFDKIGFSRFVPKTWCGDISAVVINGEDHSKAQKEALLVIANLFDQKQVGDNGEAQLYLSESVKKLINEKEPHHEVVSFDGPIYLGNVISAVREDNAAE